MSETVAEKPGRLGRMAAAFAEGIGLALARFPVASLAILVLAVFSSLLVENIEPFGPERTLRFLAALSAGGAAAVAATLLGEALRRAAVARIALSLAAALAAGGLVWLGDRIGVFRPALGAAIVLSIPLAPHLVRSSSLRFWTFLHWGTFGVSLAFVSVLLFVLGVSAILEMVRYLFGVGISSRAYQHIYVTATTLVGPLFALGRIPQDFSDEAVIAGHSKDRLSSGLGILHNWIAAPLALVMALVLHVYAAKIVATGELPKNQIGWIVSGFALFVLSARVAADPFMRYGGAATRLFGRVWALALVVPIALLAYALFLRIAEHGATVERYYLAVAALAAGCIVAAQAPARTRGDLRVMTAIPVALLALSAFGPWGVSATVARSQIAWLTSEVATVDGQLRFGDLTNEARDTARSRVRALADAGALDRILPRLAEADRNAVAGLHDEPLETVILDRLGLAYGTPSPNHFAFSASETGPFDVVGYDTVFAYLSSNPGDLNAASPGEQVVRIVIEGPDVAVRYLGTTDRFESARLLRAPPDPADTRPFTLDLTTKGGRSLRLFVRSVFFNPASESEASATFDLALRRGEWENPASLGGDGNR